MDGRFVPNISLGPAVVEACRRATRLPVDVHLMIESAERYLDAFVDAGASSVSVHVEALPHLQRALDHLRKRGVGGRGSRSTPRPRSARSRRSCPRSDFVLVMSVNPGFAGQKLLPASLDKIRRLREAIRARGLAARIQVDGGVHLGNIRTVVEAGRRDVVAGAAAFAGGTRRPPSGALIEAAGCIRVKVVVTGAAGFIGSHVAESLVAGRARGRRASTASPTTTRAPIKEANLARAPRRAPGFRLVEARLQEADLAPLLDGAAHVYHLAAQAGVRASWGREFAHYTDHNVLATQRLLEAALRARAARRSSTPRRPPSTATPRASRCERTGRASPSPPTASPSSRPSTSPSSTSATTACPRSACASSPSTARASGPTWPSTAS